MEEEYLNFVAVVLMMEERTVVDIFLG